MPELTQSHRETWNRSAANYATFASHSAIYQDTAAALVGLAGIKAGMTVVDLACGSGVVTETILRQRGGKNVTIIATDFSDDCGGERAVSVGARHLSL
jgi:ubiquinone/menaquinone biosynthesis C-methylase UbiE